MKINKIVKQVNEYVDQNLHFTALELIKQIIKDDYSDYIKFVHADILRLCGKYLQALKVFNQINLEAISDNQRYLVHLNIGTLYRDMGESLLGIEELKKCLQYDVCDTTPIIFLSTLLLRIGNNKDAINYLEAALIKEGNLDEVYYNLAINHSILGDYEKASNYILQCIYIDSNYPNAKELKKDLGNLRLRSWHTKAKKNIKPLH